MTDRVRVGVIGVGNMGSNHVRVYSMLRHAEVVAVADPDGASRERVATTYGLRSFASHRDLLGSVDAVSVAVPTPLHVPIALECLERGLHVLVEKPIAADVVSARRLVDTAHARGLVLQVGHVERFNPAVREVEEILKTERVIAISARRLSPPTPQNRDDVVLDLLIHDIDVALRFARSSVRGASAVGALDARGELALVCAHLTFTSGVVADLVASKVSQQRVRELDVTTHRSFIAVDYRTRDVAIHRRGVVDPAGRLHEAVTLKPIVPAGEPLYSELEHFVACVRGAGPQLRPDEAIEALALALRIQQGARQTAVGAPA